MDSDDSKQGTADMTAFLFAIACDVLLSVLSGLCITVQNLLQQMQSRFQTMSETIVTKIDEMGSRINELEQSINELKTEMGGEGSQSPLASTKEKPEDSE